VDSAHTGYYDDEDDDDEIAYVKIAERGKRVLR